MSRFTVLGIAVVALSISLAAASCHDDATPDVTPIKSPPTTCGGCADQACAAPTTACSAKSSCKAITDCVASRTPCTGARADDPMCDDDAIKVVCARMSQPGVATYSALLSCQYKAQCGTCSDLCVLPKNAEKCVLGDSCDQFNTDFTDCLSADGGLADAAHVPSDAGDAASSDAGASDDGGANDGGGDDATASDAGGSALCALASAAEVSTALGIAPLAAPVTSGTGGGGDVTECNYASGSNIDAVQIRYETNDTVALFMEGEASFTANGVPTSPVMGLGDMAYSVTIGDENTLVTLKGTTEVEVVATADVSALESLTAQLITSF